MQQPNEQPQKQDEQAFQEQKHILFTMEIEAASAWQRYKDSQLDLADANAAYDQLESYYRQLVAAGQPDDDAQV